MQTLVPRSKPVVSEDWTRTEIGMGAHFQQTLKYLISIRVGFLLFYYDLVRNQFVCDDLCLTKEFFIFEAVNMPTLCNLMVKLVPMVRFREGNMCMLR